MTARPLQLVSPSCLLLDLDWRPVLLSDPSADAKGHVNGVRCLVAVKVKWVRATVAEGAAARVCARLPEGVHCVTQPARVPQAPFGFLEDTFETVRTHRLFNDDSRCAKA